MKHELNYSYDPYSDVMTIEGQKFSGELLRFLASSPPIGVLFRVISNVDGDCGFEIVDNSLRKSV